MIRIVKLSFFYLFFLLIQINIGYQYPIKNEINFNNEQNQYFNQLFHNAEDLIASGNYKQAIKEFEFIYNNSTSIKNYDLLLSVFIKLGNILIITDDFNKSQKYFKEALNLSVKLDRSDLKNYFKKILKVFEYFEEAKALSRSLKYEDSLAKFDMAISLSKEINNIGFEMKCIRQKGLVYWAMDRIQDFYRQNVLALPLALQLKQKEDELKIYNCIGLFYWRNESFSEALKYYDKSLAISQQIGTKQLEADCLSNIGLVYYDLGNIDRAIEYMNKSLAIVQKFKDEISTLIDLMNIGAFFRKRGFINDNKQDILSALEYYDMSLSISIKNNDLESELKILNNIGVAYSNLGDNIKSLSYLNKAYNIAKKLSDNKSLGMILNNLGNSYSNIGDFEQSTKYYKEAIDLALTFKGNRILWEAYLEIGNSYKKQGKYADAVKNYKNSIAIIEDVRSQINLEELKASYLGSDKRIDAYRNLLDVLVTLNQQEPGGTYGEEAFDFLERGRARAFLDSLEVSKIEISDGASQALINRETEAMKEISQIYTKLLTPELTEEQKSGLNKKLDEYEQQLESIKRNIRQSSPEYAGLKYPRIISLKEAQQNLIGSKTVFISFALAKEKSYAFAVYRDRMKIYSLPPLAEIRTQVQTYLGAVSNPNNQDFRLGYDLFQELIQPGLDRNVKTIIIVPDDLLHFLPFETLLTRNDNASWLIKEYKVGYAPSLSSLRELKQREISPSRRTKKDLLAFGDPDFGARETDAPGNVLQNLFPSSDYKFPRLKYSGLEIRKIAALFDKAKAQVFVREQASEENLKALDLRDYKIIHLATHGLIDDRKTARSSVILRLDEDPAEDGFIQMRDIFNLKLHADLVALSACSTGGGQLIKGEGIEGLSRAFFYAGASSVLMSLWAINDQATCQLMERFYFHLRSSKSLIDSLRLAKMEMIASGTLSHPYYWAAFIINGDSARVIFPGKWPIRLITGLALGTGVLLVVFLIKKKSKKRNKTHPA